jgi:hypothetical protein
LGQAVQALNTTKKGENQMKEDDYFERWEAEIGVKVQQYLLIIPTAFDSVLRQSCGRALNHAASPQAFEQILRNLERDGKIKLRQWERRLIVERK